jgi:lipid-A-disaccharide synthase-like uncharacterized protein
MDHDPFWLTVGFLGQALFSMRFIVQWIKSERMRRSVVPLAFWYFSLAGGAALFVYALHRNDPVFIVGQGLGIFIYLRNLWLIYHEPTVADEPPRAA